MIQIHDDTANTNELFTHDTEQGFNCFVEQNYPSLCFFANRFVRDSSAAEDIVSVALMKVWEKREQLPTLISVKKYCYTVVRNACLLWLKERQRTNIAGELTPNSVYNEETILHNIIRTEVIAELHAAIHRLPAKSSEVFCKLYIEGKSVAETAKEMQLTVSTIKSHKRNGLMMLRTMITSSY